MGREVGKIVEVRGISVKAELFELLPPYIISDNNLITSPRINTFVKTRVGLDTVICQITGEYNDEKSAGCFSGYFLDLTIKGYIDGNRFVQGLRLLPIVAASVELLDNDDLEIIHEYDNSSFPIGNSLFDMNRIVKLNYNDIIPSHVGIFGNTGSGKSNTLTKLLESYSKVLKNNKNGRMLVFDINNEYGEDAICDRDIKQIFTLSTRNQSKDKIPFNLNNLQEDDWCILLNATEATQKPVIKSAFKDKRTKEEYEGVIRSIIRNSQNHLFISLKSHVGSNIVGIDHFYWNSTKNEFYYENGENKLYPNNGKFEEKLDEISVNIPTDGMDNFLFRLYVSTAYHIGYGTQYDYISPLLRRAEKLEKDFNKVFEYSTKDIFDKSNIVVIQLADVNQDIKQILPAIISMCCFEKQIKEKDENGINSILNIIIDEAHNLLYEDTEDKRHTSMTLESFEKIVKEGRKYGTFLWIASQRPSDISGTIISQMHNYFIHKLVNPYDINKIRKTVAFLDEESINMITVLGPGECILSGNAVSIPLFMKIQQVEKQNRPNSENVVLFGENGIFN